MFVDEKEARPLTSLGYTFETPTNSWFELLLACQAVTGSDTSQLK